MSRILATLTLLLALLGTQARERQNFDAGWLFLLGDTAAMASPAYPDGHWPRLSLPHDWAIGGDFHASNPAGADGGALPGGVGWYRKHFVLQECDSTRSRWFLEFDGVYMNSTVYVNGTEVGRRPYGYSSFEYDITPYVSEGDNVVAVRVDNSDQPNSRWYSGCGIYRHVWLTTTSPVHVKHWGVHIQTHASTGKIDVETDVEGRNYKLRHTVYDADGRQVGMRVRRPHLWSPRDPYIYKVCTQVLQGGRVVDEVWTNTAFRSFRFDAQTGFWLNGENMKINGVCEHHDFGALGAALHEDALHRKLTKLKQMGVNAIRSSHNPPAPELLNMCDSMGFLVMDESFDMWRRRKTRNDYARFFDEWHVRDLTDMVLRDRNHPCIVMWSIGNEVLEQWTDAAADTLSLEQANLILNAGHATMETTIDKQMSVNTLLADHLANIIRQYDTSRPITAGCNEVSPRNHLFKGKALDVIGFNYHHEQVKNVPRNFPGRPFLMSESVSALQTTGFYLMPSDSVRIAPGVWWKRYTDPSFMCSSYDNMHAPWSATHEETWDVVKHTPYVSGQFIWTGFDYIGEPTPYSFPARSSYFGIIDLAGQPKDVYYMYQSEWTDTPVLHLFPHWNWLEGQQVDMWCYYNHADEVELFVNGRSQGVRRKADGHQYHVQWRVTFEPGEVRVVARKDGQAVREQVLRTAGQPERVLLKTDYSGRELSFVQAVVVDKDGNRCPWAENQIFFSGADGLQVVATDNGCQTSMERFTSPHRKAFFGRLVAVVKGSGVLTARAVGLEPAAIRVGGRP